MHKTAMGGTPGADGSLSNLFTRAWRNSGSTGLIERLDLSGSDKLVSRRSDIPV